MKFIYLVFLILPLVALTYTHPNPSNLDFKIEDLEEAARTKRSGSGHFDFLSSFKKGLLKGIGKASSGSSHGSSKSHEHEHEPEPEHHHDEAKFDSWQFKKSILNTLFQAVKAITGGVTAIKGQLIKGSGYLISGGGKLIASSGDVVTNVGKKIATSAQLVPAGYHKSHFAKLSGGSSHSHTGTGHSESFTSYESPSGPSYPSHSISHTAPAAVHTHTYDIQSPVSHVSNSYGAPIHVSSHSGSGHGYSQPTYQSPISSYGRPVDGIYD